MPVSLLALYRRPAGGEEALETFRRRYADEHLPLVRQTPGLRSVIVHRVAHAFQESDVVMVAEMVFDSRDDIDASLGSEPMKQAGRVLREIAPGLLTLLVLEPEPEALIAHDSSLVGLWRAEGGTEAGAEAGTAPVGEREPLPDNRASELGGSATDAFGGAEGARGPIKLTDAEGTRSSGSADEGDAATRA